MIGIGNYVNGLGIGPSAWAGGSSPEAIASFLAARDSTPTVSSGGAPSRWTDDLKEYLPWIIGGVVLLGVGIVGIRAFRRRRR